MSARTVERAEGFLASADEETTQLHSERAEGFLVVAIADINPINREPAESFPPRPNFRRSSG